MTSVQQVEDETRAWEAAVTAPPESLVAPALLGEAGRQRSSSLFHTAQTRSLVELAADRATSQSSRTLQDLDTMRGIEREWATEHEFAKSEMWPEFRMIGRWLSNIRPGQSGSAPSLLFRESTISHQQSVCPGHTCCL